MLERVLEQEVMDSKMDAEEYASFDNQAVNEEFVARALELAPKKGSVLDIGTGPADIAVLFARRAPGLRFLAIDLGEHMLAMARSNVLRSGLADRIKVERADAKSTRQPAESFDMIISNSLVHHIPEPLLLFQEVKRVARPGAAIFIKDLHRPETDAELTNLVDLYAKGCTPYQRQSFWDSLHAGLIVSEVEALCRQAELLGVTVRRTSDRHWCVEQRAGATA